MVMVEAAKHAGMFLLVDRCCRLVGELDICQDWVVGEQLHWVLAAAQFSRSKEVQEYES
jgi:hypothetical protein